VRDNDTRRIEWNSHTIRSDDGTAKHANSGNREAAEEKDESEILKKKRSGVDNLQLVSCVRLEEDGGKRRRRN